MNERAPDLSEERRRLGIPEVLTLLGNFSGRVQPDLDYDWDIDRPSIADNAQTSSELTQLLYTTRTFDAIVSLTTPRYGIALPGFGRYFTKPVREGVKPTKRGYYDSEPKYEGSYLEVSYDPDAKSLEMTYSYPEHSANNPKVLYNLVVTPDTIVDTNNPDISLQELVCSTKHAAAHIIYHYGLAVSGA